MEHVQGRVKIDLFDVEFPAEGFQAQYANVVSVNHTPWDFSLLFSVVDITPAPESKPPKITNRAIAKITMSPQLIKGLIRALQENVSRYEKEYRTLLPEKMPDTMEQS